MISINQTPSVSFGFFAPSFLTLQESMRTGRFTLINHPTYHSSIWETNGRARSHTFWWGQADGTKRANTVRRAIRSDSQHKCCPRSRSQKKDQDRVFEYDTLSLMKNRRIYCTDNHQLAENGASSAERRSHDAIIASKRSESAKGIRRESSSKMHWVPSARVMTRGFLPIC
jgi:hypothetical protein